MLYVQPTWMYTGIGVSGARGVQTPIRPTEIFGFFWQSERKVERKRKKKKMGGGLIVNIFFGAQIFSSGLQIFSGGLRNFRRGRGVKKILGGG